LIFRENSNRDDTSRLTSPTFDFSGARRAALSNSKPKGCGNGKRRAKLGNKLGKDNMHLSFSTSP